MSEKSKCPMKSYTISIDYQMSGSQIFEFPADWDDDRIAQAIKDDPWDYVKGCMDCCDSEDVEVTDIHPERNDEEE